MSSYIRQKNGETDWLVHDRFGMFIHRALCAMPTHHHEGFFLFDT